MEREDKVLDRRSGVQMPSNLRRSLLDTLTLAAILVALAWGFNQRASARGASFRAQEVLQLAKRAAIQDALIGQSLSWPVGEPYRDDGAQAALDSGRRRIFWLIDPEHCLACFSENRSWNVMAAIDDLDAHVILLGPVPDRLVSHVLSLRETSIWRADPSEVRRMLGGQMLPNMKLFIDEEGVVVLADARSSGQTCGWSFNAQVSTLVGGSSAARIRSQTNQ